MKKTTAKRLITILMALALGLSLLPAAIVLADEPAPFTLVSATGDLIADGGTRFITKYEQDHDTKLIKATIQIQHGSTDARALRINCVGVEISFNRDVAPHAYFPTSVNGFGEVIRDYVNVRPDYASNLLFPVNGSSIDDELEYFKYCDSLVDGFSAFTNHYIKRYPNGGLIAASIAAPEGAAALSVARGQTVDIFEFYFMPVNRDYLDLNMDMFGYEFVFDGPAGMIRNATYLLNGNYRLEADERQIPIVYQYRISPASFKVHMKRPQPNVFARDDRTVGGYDPSYMEWSLDGITYQSGAITVPDVDCTIYVRGRGDTAYSRTSGLFDDAQYGNYKRYFPSDPVEVNFRANFFTCEDDVYLTKSTQKRPPPHADGKVRVGDIIEYTIVAWNEGHTLSTWADAVLTDELPAGVSFSGNVRLNGVLLTSPSGFTFTGGVLRIELGNLPGSGGLTPTPPASVRRLTFDVVVDGTASGRIINEVMVAGTDGENGDPLVRIADDGDAYGGGGIDVILKSRTPTINQITEGDRTISGTGINGAEVVVTLPDGTVLPGVTVSGDTWTVTIPPEKNLVAGDVVKAVQNEPNRDPSDDVQATVSNRPDPVKVRSKTATNLTTNNQVRNVGDILEYKITATNNGDAKSLWQNVIVIDPLPSGVDFEGLDKVKIDGVAAGSAATFSSGVLTVNLGDIPGGGVSRELTFEVKINRSAAGTVIINTAEVDGEDVSEPPTDPVVDVSPQPTVDEINEGDRIISGKGDANADEAWIEVSFPNSTIVARTRVRPDGTWDVPVPAGVNLVEGDIVEVVQTVTYSGNQWYPSDPLLEPVQGKKPVDPYVHKTSENTTSTDDKTRVGDRVKYTITIGNDGSPKSLWTDAVLKDILPEGISLIYSSIRLDGRTPTFSSYDANTRELLITLWRGTGDIGIVGGTSTVVTFDVLVDADAHGKTIANTVTVEGYQNDTDTEIITDTEDDNSYTVLDQSEPPEIDPITRGDKTISGRGKPGSRIIVTLPDGTEFETDVDPNGNWEVDLGPKDVNTGDVVTAVQIEKDADGEYIDPSEPAEAIVSDKNYRAVHGLVWPLAIEDYNQGGTFVAKHNVVVELRETFRTPAGPDLRVVATLVPNSPRRGLGEFTIEGVPFGDYVLTIKRPGYLIRCMKVTIARSDPDMIELEPPGPEDEGVFNLWWGDVDDSLRIDAADISLILQQINLGINLYDPRYLPECDLDANGRSDAADISLILGNLNKHVYLYAGGVDVDYFS